MTTPHALPPHPATPAASKVGSSVAGALAGLRDWLATAVGPDMAVEIATPADGHPTRLCLWPLAIVTEQGTRGGYGQRTLRLRARHAIIADGPLDEALALLDRVLGALAGEDRYQLVLEPVPGALWGSGMPRPAVLIDVPVQISVLPPTAPRVVTDLRIDGVGMRVIAGRVVAPNGVPLAAMTVTSGATETSVVTDSRGGFALTGQPAGRTVALHLSGRGLRTQVEVGPAATGPVVVTCPIERNSPEEV